MRPTSQEHSLTHRWRLLRPQQGLENSPSPPMVIKLLIQARQPRNTAPSTSFNMSPTFKPRTRLILAAAVMVSSFAVTGASATPHHNDCTLAAASATCTDTGGSALSTSPKKLDVLPHSVDPRWLALGYNPKWPQLGYDPKWEGFGYEPQYNGFQPRGVGKLR
jgi:hypothetical protein